MIKAVHLNSEYWCSGGSSPTHPTSTYLFIQGEQMILACSALKKSYRVQLTPVDLQSVRFVYLRVSPELLQARLEQRQGHFMQATMLCSQLATLEAPDPSEALIIEVQSDTSPQLLAISIQNRLEYYYTHILHQSKSTSA